MENKEEFKPIERTPNYGVNEDGCIINLFTRNKIKTSIDKHGYERVVLRDYSKIKRSMSVHRLVANAWIPNADNKPQVNHIDGNKLNNTKPNLEWNTGSENTIHSYEKELSSLSVSVSMYDIVNKTTTTYRSIQYLSIVLKVDDKLLLPYIRNSIKYPFMGRYKISILNENKVLENLNSSNFGKPVYVYDVINNTMSFYKSIGIASYYTGIRSMSKLKQETIEELGYYVRDNEIIEKPVSPFTINELKYNRENYISKPYEPWLTKYAVIDLINKTSEQMLFDNITELTNYIFKNTGKSVTKITISNVKLKPNNYSRLVYGYNIQQFNNVGDIKPWSKFTEEQIINSRYGYRTCTPIYKVIICNGEPMLLFTMNRLLSYLKPYIINDKILHQRLEKITIEKVLNSLDKQHEIKILRVGS